MTRRTTSRARPTGRALVLLVLAVLAGVLGMHALAPAGVTGTQDRTHGAAATVQAPPVHGQAADGQAVQAWPVHGQAVHASPVHGQAVHASPVHGQAVHASPVHGESAHASSAHGPSVPEAVPGCSHTDGGSDHLGHADGTCAAAGVGSPYAPPEPVPGLGAAPRVAAPDGAGRTSTGGRAPPGLAELQLLRI
ncbi:DUF6153 family protein [Streptomyces sp. NPDC059544]|uniref:DUF6153 family protein n=1 Tax=Streptomyces sp. NPDC059544 TaxID=3346861 RepID=UPI0036B313B2